MGFEDKDKLYLPCTQMFDNKKERNNIVQSLRDRVLLSASVLTLQDLNPSSEV